MKKHAIAVDIDDVIIETAPLVISHYNDTYGTNLELEDTYSRDLKVWGVDDDSIAIARVEEYLKTDEYCNAAPTKETIDALGSLAIIHELHVITGRSEFLAIATQTMLDRYFAGMFQSIEFTGMFGKASRSKLDVCRKIGADTLIDDHLGHALPVAKGGIEVLLFGDYPWNQAESLPVNVHRVKDWAEVLKYFDEQG